MVKKEELLSVLAKRYYHGLYEKILECIGKLYLFGGGGNFGENILIKTGLPEER